MGKGCRDWDFHNFYCINCGNRGIPIARAGNKLKGKNHRKLMYCPTCKHTVNHIECRNQFEVEEFLEDFKNGVYEDEAKESLSYCGNCIGIIKYPSSCTVLDIVLFKVDI